MKTKNLVVFWAVFFLGAIVSGCVGMHHAMPTAEECANNSTTAKLRSGDYMKKVDNFLIIQDASSSMSEKYGKNFTYQDTKLAYSKELVQCMNNTLPNDFDVNGGMRVFGLLQSDEGLVYGMNRYSKGGLDNAVQALTGTANLTPLARAIDDASGDLTDMRGNGAVIIFSDGLNTESADPVAAAMAMKEKYGQNICIYTVLIGNTPEGRSTLQQIADTCKCGYATDLATIVNAAGMEKFVTDVFLTKAPAPVMKKKPAPVMRPEKKITMTLLIEFDFDKAVIRPGHHNDIKKVADAMKEYPGAQAKLTGHTDSKGTESYNMELSKRRADAVKKYLVDKFGIDAARISTDGYGESMPVASNKTPEGRQRNRRVVVEIK
jgi:OOP family OmpA-OmpF porin